MKHFAILLLVSTVWQSCCHQPAPAPIHNSHLASAFFVSGIYTAFEKSSYCRTWDTLFLTKDRRLINVYRITRLTSFQRNLEDDYDSIERDSSSWTGSYDPSKAIMHALDEGRPLIFQPSTNTAYLDSHVFNKIE